MFSRPILILIIFTAFTPGGLWAGTTGKLTGKVTDGENGSPLAGVNVIVAGTSYGAATDASGAYLITNVPAGTYSLTASMIGYNTVTAQNVRVSADLSTRQDFALATTVLEGEYVIVEATRPLIQQDITSSRTIKSGEMVLNMPVDNYIGAMATVAGAVVEGGELHFRGGRAEEIVYLLDNTAIVNPLTGKGDTDIPTVAIEEIHAITGGFSAEYGNAQSGVVNVITKDGGDFFSGKIRYTTSDYGLSSGLSSVGADEVPENQNRVELALGGPAPLLGRFLPGRLSYYLTGDFLETQGRFVNQDGINSIVMAKLTYHPIPRMTIRVNSLMNWGNRNYFQGAITKYTAGPTRDTNQWKKTVYEDGVFDIEGWAGNGVLDTEDVGIDDGMGNIIGAGNGIIDYIDINANNEWDEGEPTEDLILNGKVDAEDLNHNGQIDVFNMLDHLADIEESSNQFGLFFSHQLSERTFYEIRLTRYYTSYFQNVAEIINEDVDGDGRLDTVDEWVQLSSGWYTWVDHDGDGYFDRGDEDLNGNGRLDPYGEDLFTDNNRNTYVDVSEIGPPPREYYRKMGIKDPASQWMPWGDVPNKFGLDNDGYATYGNGTTWDRIFWFEDESSVYGLKFDIDSQINANHRVRAGIDYNRKDLFRYRGRDRYGYEEWFEIKPYQFATYIQDKMESAGIIMNIGLRYDFFDAGWDQYPSNLADPTWEAGEDIFSGHEDLNSNGRLDISEDLNGNGVLDQVWIAEKYQVGGLKEDTNGNGQLDPGEDLNANGILDFPEYLVYPGDIKDPQKVPIQDFISPRLGISYPISENNKMYFSYGRYFSAPLGRNLYDNLGFDLQGYRPVMGNPSLEAEKTVSYEAGIIHAFRNQSTIEAKGFFKNVTGLSSTRRVYHNQRDWFGLRYNGDYGNIRGFEMISNLSPLALGPLRLSGLTTYTFQIAKTKFSSPWDSYMSEFSGLPTPEEETYASWDQRHTLSMNFILRTSESIGLIFGGWRTNILYSYGSGTRWTPPRGQDLSVPENTKVLPPKHTVDVRFTKVLRTRGFEAEVFIDVRNLFDRQNLIAIADEEWYALFDGDDEDGLPDHDPQGKYDDPTVFARGRLVRVGLQLNLN